MTPTPSEIRAGRFMRAEDHGAGDGGDGGGDGGQGDASGTDKAGTGDEGGADGDDTLLGGASDAGTGDAGKDGDGAVQDGKGDDGDDGDDGKEAAKADADADDVVPEAYALDPIKIGEGDEAQTIEIDAQLLTDVTPQLKEAGITAKQLKGIAPTVVPKIQEQVIKRLGDEHAALRSDWERQSREDKDIGGAKMTETLALAGRALDRFGAKSVKDEQGNETNEFRVLLNESGLGNHPVMLKMFREVGTLVGEDGDLIRPDVTPNKKTDRLEALYPDDVPKQK